MGSKHKLLTEGGINEAERPQMEPMDNGFPGVDYRDLV